MQTRIRACKVIKVILPPAAPRSREPIMAWSNATAVAEESCAASGFPWACWLLIQVAFYLALNELRMLAVKTLEATEGDRKGISDTWNSNWRVRVAGLACVIISVYLSFTAFGDGEALTPTRIIGWVLAQLELVTWLGCSILRLRRKVMYPVLATSYVAKPLGKRFATAVPSLATWAAAGIALSNLFALTPPRAQVLSVRRVVRAFWSTSAAKGARDATKAMGVPPMALWLAGVAAWVALGVALEPSLAGELAGATVGETLSSWCSAAFSWYDPRGWACWAAGKQVATQAAETVVKKARWGKK